MPCPSKPPKITPILPEHTNKGCVHWFSFSTNNSASTMDNVHPCIIISKYRPKSDRVIISPISDIDNYLENGKLKYPFHAPLLRHDNPFLDKDSVVLLDQVFTIGKDELCEEWYMGQVADTRKIDEAIIYNFDLFESMQRAFTELLEQYKPLYMSNFTRK